MDTKNCPFCGEEVLTTAIKCKHCGEWLEEQKHTDTEILTPNSSITQFNYKWLRIACLVAIFVSIMGYIQNLDLGIQYGGGGKYKILAVIANFIPEWIVITCAGVLDVYFFLGLRQYAIANNKSKGIPFITYIVMITIGYFLYLTLLFIDYDSMTTDESLAVFIPFLYTGALIITLITELILGLKLKYKLTEAPYVGVGLLFCGITDIIVSLINFEIIENWQWWWIDLEWLMDLASKICWIIFYFRLGKFYVELEIEETVVK
jgi:hypothetical protein